MKDSSCLLGCLYVEDMWEESVVEVFEFEVKQPAVCATNSGN